MINKNCETREARWRRILEIHAANLELLGGLIHEYAQVA